MSDNDPLVSQLTVLDSDLAQAIQSCKEELTAGYLCSDERIVAAKRVFDDLYSALEESRIRATSWGGEFCFDRVGHFQHTY